MLKVGVGCAGDELDAEQAVYKAKRSAIVIQGDRQNRQSFPNLKACGLRSLVAILARKRMSKGQQTKNWEQPSYTPAMVRYAANDAAAGLLCLG